MPNWNYNLGGSGNWASTLNWTPNSVPSTPGAVAIMDAAFAPGFTAPIEVNLGTQTWPLGTLDLTYNGVNSYQFVNGTLQMVTAGGFSEIIVRGTTHTFTPTANIEILGITDFITMDANAQLRILGNLSGSNQLFLYGLGTISLVGANTFSGNFQLNSGSLSIDNGSGLGTGILNFVSDPSLTPGTAGTGSLFSSATISVANTITTANGVAPRIGTVGGTTLSLTGTLTFNGNAATDIHIFNLASSGTVELAPTSATIGAAVDLFIDAGRLKIGNAAGAALVGGAASMTIANGTTLDVNGNNLTLKSVLGSGSIINNGGVPVLLTLDVASSLSFSATVFDGTGGIEFRKTGAGTVTINTSQNAAIVTVAAGTMALAGSGSLANATLGVQTLAGSTLDISGITGTTANISNINNIGTVVLGNKTLNVTASAIGFVGSGAYDGGAGTGTLRVDVASANFSLGSTSFTNWTAGSDTITINGNTSANSLTGSAQNDSINGGDGNDTLAGGTGNDTLNGAVGTDMADLSAATSQLAIILDASGNATVTATGIGTDTLIAIESLQGGSAADVFIGNASANLLDGGAGADTLAGGQGDDVYRVDNSSDRVNEAFGEGNDVVIATASYDLAVQTQANVEQLILQGTAVGGNGNDLANTIVGNAMANGLAGGLGNDTISGGDNDDSLDGQGGNDSMIGGTGVDTYFVDSLSDTVVEDLTLAEFDTIWTTVTLTLPNGVEILILNGGTLNINGTGNEGLFPFNARPNLMLGNNAANTMTTFGGDDIILGRDGNDTINTGAGSALGVEIISGGVGLDTLTSGGGHDYFTYENINEGGDTITDFGVAGNDLDIFDLRPMFQPTFTNIAGITTVAQAVASGHLTFTQAGANTQVFADANGGGNNNVLLATLNNTTAATVQILTLI